jgi:negative regulator of sigma E activity
MKERISELLDGELEDAEARRQIAALTASGELRRAWDTYQLIGDAIRGHVAPDLSARFAARLAQEPTVVAPAPRERDQPAAAPPREHDRRKAPGWALPAAAGVAAVAVVAWLAQGTLAPQREVAQKPPSPAAAQPASVAKARPETPPASGVGNYLLAHQRYSGIAAMQGVAPYVRTVSVEPQGRR